MSHDDLERILAQEKDILPSAGFAASVMEAVRREVATPPPLSFPWKRALPGAVATSLAIVWALVEGILQVIRGNVASPLPASVGLTLTSILESSKTAAACLVILALFVSFVSVKLAMHFTRRMTV